MESKDVQADELCFITITFPVVDDNAIVAVRKKVIEALADLKRVKVETRLTLMRDSDRGN